MTHYSEFDMASSATIENRLNQRIEEIRLRRNITQQQLAQRAGVSRSTITRLAQSDKGISLDSFIRILRALKLLDSLEQLLPSPEVSPLEIFEQQNRPARKRARAARASSGEWTWDDTVSDRDQR